MTSREDISLQLTLKSIEHISTQTASNGHNEKLANDIADMYNIIYDKIKTYHQ